MVSPVMRPALVVVWLLRPHPRGVRFVTLDPRLGSSVTNRVLVKIYSVAHGECINVSSTETMTRHGS
jgi:hypothetical protein|eukprot:SAG25_NODE_587_length_6734_cov_5.509721_6_plen_67_part_00